MAPDYKTHLAAAVLNEGKIVSYRSLSRELKVHSNVAKKMLYDFHRSQTSKKPGSVHATYLLDGVPPNSREPSVNGNQQDGEDVHMQSSPYMSSSMPQGEDEDNVIPYRKIILAREADLEAARARLGSIQSINIYSLGPSAVQNLQILSECNRAIIANYQHEDPLVAGAQYGVIQNPNVRRRTAKRPPIPPQSASAVKSTGKFSDEAPAVKPSTQTSNNAVRPPSSIKASRSTSQAESKAVEKKTASKAAPLKRETSDIFKSFSKPKSKLSRENTSSSAGASSAPATLQPEAKAAQADEPMKDASEDENEEDFIASNKPKSAQNQSKSEREEKLRQMMDDEDESMEDTPGEPTPEASQVAGAIDAPSTKKAASPEPTVVSTGGRRRGRRKVMKKKTIKDEEGYLVTKEEPAWESFSEEEPQPVKEKTPVSTAVSSTAKGKKSSSSGKPGQGNIMSFFGKK